ncbi:MAG: LytTR family DNA-binding domain-containing protein, partial [Saprospiraceae bacterium]|nr:LytTR family DNA-binding domain-containing protein [Saprospiraceae bacterium]
LSIAMGRPDIDLVILDVQMPEIDGFQTAQMLKVRKRTRDIPIIFLTAAFKTEEFQQKGYDLGAADYLLKPISFERFLNAVGKAFDSSQAHAGNDTAGGESDDSFLFVKVDQKMVRVDPGDIRYIESRRDYVNIVTGSKEILAHQTIRYLEERLRPEGFIRIHRSFIVAIDKIESWSTTEIEVAGNVLPIGRTYKKEAIRLLEMRSDLL